jgi:FtsH-binding integral membrane protein
MKKAMTIVGIILVIIGLVATGLEISGNSPGFLQNLPVPFWAWIVCALVGGLLVYFNKRPGN